MYLSKLFEECLHIPYETVGDAVNYATRREGGHLTLYLQASDGTRDWLHNLDFPAAAYRREGRCVFRAHRGFLRAHRALCPILDTLVTDGGITAVTVAGYSHGAALGVLSYEYFWYHRPDLRPSLRGYGFGCPRVLYGGDRHAIRERFRDFTVIRNLDDVITHLPPALLGYYHVGTLLAIGARGRYSCVDAHRPEAILRELTRAGL